MKVFAIYLAVLSAQLLFWPSSLLRLGFTNVSTPWVSTLGYVVGVLSTFYFMAIREKAKNFYAWTVVTRFPMIFFFAVLVARGDAPPVVLLIGAFETAAAVWTKTALRHELSLRPERRDVGA
jgi:hypothetical protein